MLRVNIHPSQFKRLYISLCSRYIKKSTSAIKGIRDFNKIPKPQTKKKPDHLCISLREGVILYGNTAVDTAEESHFHNTKEK